MKKPFRVLSAILMLAIAAELYGILHTPTYDTELAAARAEYNAALRDNLMLIEELNNH